MAKKKAVQAASDFRVGDTVKPIARKSFPPMYVNKIEGDFVQCFWWQGTDFRSFCFHRSMIAEAENRTRPVKDWYSEN